MKGRFKGFPRKDADTGAGIVLTPRRSTDQRPHSFIFVHTHKVGGSTVRGVKDHIARKFGLQIRADWISGRKGGGHATYMEIANRAGAELEGAFLLTWVRHPVHRCLSAFNWFAVANQGIEATDDNLIKFANEECRDYVAKYLGMPEDMSAETIAKRYDFIGTTERFEESMLLLKEKLPMPVALRDMLYIKCKDSLQNRTMFLRLQSKIGILNPYTSYAKQSPRVRDFFESEQFNKSNAVDFALWHAANEMLDRQRSAFGHARIELETAKYKQLLAEADTECQPLVSREHRDCNGLAAKRCLKRMRNGVPENTTQGKTTLWHGRRESWREEERERKRERTRERKRERKREREREKEKEREKEREGFLLQS